MDEKTKNSIMEFIAKKLAEHDNKIHILLDLASKQRHSLIITNISVAVLAIALIIHLISHIV